MFSHGLSSLKNAASTDTRLTCLRTASGSATTSQPNTEARPASGVSSVPRIRINVDLPLPLGPSIPVTPPVSMIKSISWRATLSFHSRRHHGAPVSRARRGKAFLTPWISIAVICFSPAKFPCSLCPPPGRGRFATGADLPTSGEARKRKRTDAVPNNRTVLSVTTEESLEEDQCAVIRRQTPPSMAKVSSVMPPNAQTPRYMDTPEWVCRRGQSIPAPARSQEAWSWSTTKAETNASSRHDWYRPDGPECPEPRSVLRMIGRAESVIERSFATHLAGSQNGTRGSLRPAVTSIAGYAAR